MIDPIVMKRTCGFVPLLLLFVLVGTACGLGTAARSAAVRSPAIVIGFVGGYVSHDNPIHAEVQLAADLKGKYPTGVHVEAFENHRGEDAYNEILRLLDVNHDGSLSAAEKQSARIILYGHSWGASESVYVARELEKDGVPVLLTIQVDSVSKHRRDDSVIPANVKQAANFYQPHGLVRGESRIRAADPSRTRILGNFRFDYREHPISCSSYPWWDRLLVKSHTEIECDPNVWSRVEALIRSNLPAYEAASMAINTVKEN
jgi:hypothetical protein